MHPPFSTTSLQTYHRLCRKFLELQKDIVLCDRALCGYLFLLRQSFKKALAQYFKDLTEDAQHATVDWWRKFALLRINSPGRKIKQYLRPIPEIRD